MTSTAQPLDGVESSINCLHEYGIGRYPVDSAGHGGQQLSDGWGGGYQGQCLVRGMW